MADNDNPEWETVFCHECENHWARQVHGLICPRCSSEFVEIIEENDAGGNDGSPSRSERSPAGFQLLDSPLLQGVNNTRRTEFRSNNGRFSFVSTTYRSPRNTTRPRADSPRPPPLETQHNHPLSTLREFLEIAESFAPGTTSLGHGGTRQFLSNPAFGDPDWLDREEEREQRRQRARALNEFETIGDLLQTFNDLTANLQTGQDGGRRRQARYPFFMNPFFAGFGHNPDAVHSREEFDRIMSQLMDQAQGTNAPPPAPAHAIATLPKKAMDQTMTGDDGLAECSICMDNVEMGTLVTVLPCSHWFHEQCITAWLTQHGTCPHCRHEITTPMSRSSSNRSSGPSTPATAAPGSRENPLVVQDPTPSPSTPRRRPMQRSSPSGDGSNNGWHAWFRGHGPSH